jgi:phosphoglycolate phosphatase-like HAD superfamily hydrolase
LLQDAASGQAADFRPLAGVEDWLQMVEDDPTVLAAIATGGWQHTARLKLELSGLDRFTLPLASSDDAIARTEIMQIAARQLRPFSQVNDVVISYVGDGVWDLEASRQLGWTFIGIADGTAADHLRNSGAVHVLADFKRPETEKNIGVI